VSDRLIASEATEADDSYNATLAHLRDLGRSGGIDGLLEKHSLSAILIPTNSERHRPCPS
jgi:hypothetical protein